MDKFSDKWDSVPYIKISKNLAKSVIEVIDSWKYYLWDNLDNENKYNDGIGKIRWMLLLYLDNDIEQQRTELLLIKSQYKLRQLLLKNNYEEITHYLELLDNDIIFSSREDDIKERNKRYIKEEIEKIKHGKNDKIQLKYWPWNWLGLPISIYQHWHEIWIDDYKSVLEKLNVWSKQIQNFVSNVEEYFTLNKTYLELYITHTWKIFVSVYYMSAHTWNKEEYNITVSYTDDKLIDILSFIHWEWEYEWVTYLERY